MPVPSSVVRRINIPDNSRFILTINAIPANVSIDVMIAVSDGTIIRWTTSDVLNRTKALMLRRPLRYRLAFVFAFAGSPTTVDFAARIEKPASGGPHGDPIAFSVERPPITQHADISLVTRL